MALEISEIAIQMVVDEDADDEEEEDEEDGRKKKKKKDKDDDGCCELDRQEIVDECVRRVMKMLKNKQER
ncbi:MAG TPA: DUF5908 family protein [Thermoanaerobaculia bacterium]